MASVRLGCELNLEAIADKLWDLSYDKSSFTPLNLMIKKPYAMGMVFASGNMIVTGTTSWKDCRLACLKLWVRIKFCGFPVRKPIIQIQNITSSVNLEFKVRLNELLKNELLKGMV